MRSSLLLMLAAAALPVSQGFAAGMLLPLAPSSSRAATRAAARAPLPALGLRMQVESKDKPAVKDEKVDREKDVQKFGLEVGVFKALTYSPCPRGSPGQYPGQRLACHAWLKLPCRGCEEIRDGGVVVRHSLPLFF